MRRKLNKDKFRPVRDGTDVPDGTKYPFGDQLPILFPWRDMTGQIVANFKPARLQSGG